MFIIKSEHSKYYICLILLFTLVNCQLQEPNKNHGINFLENRDSVLKLNQTNKNDVITLIGSPHSKSINDDNRWYYFERTITRGKLHKLGRNILKDNNVLELQFNNYGILTKKKLYIKNNMNSLSYDKEATENVVSSSSFMEKFLSSLKQKMSGRTKKK